MNLIDKIKTLQRIIENKDPLTKELHKELSDVIRDKKATIIPIEIISSPQSFEQKK